MKTRWVSTLALFLGCATLALAQSATVTGTVKDQTGAVVANAPVSITAIATGRNVTLNTTTTGNYSISGLDIGKYTLVVELMGFKKYVRENIQLTTGQVLRQDIGLEIGNEKTTVTVTQEGTLLQKDSAEITHRISLEEMRQLPLFEFGIDPGTTTNGLRDPYAVAQMLPGVTYNRDAKVMLINGLPQEDIQYRVDGQVVGLVRDSTNTHSTQPSVEAVEEIAITTSNYSAEFGSVGGALFNVTMKSGSNQLHGSLYDYMANEAVNAHDPWTHQRNKQRRNNWGLTVGAPIMLPGIYSGLNQTFFFWSFDGLNQQTTVNNPAGGNATVPVDAYRLGDFSSLFDISSNNVIKVGATPTSFAHDYISVDGNTVKGAQLFDPGSERKIICDTSLSPKPDCTNGTEVLYRSPLLGNDLNNATVRGLSGTTYTGMDPVAVALQTYIPVANVANTPIANNYYAPFTNNQQSRIPSLKFDHNITATSRFSIYLQDTGRNQPNYNAFALNAEQSLPEPITSATRLKAKSPNIRLNFDQTLTPVLQLRIGVGWSSYDVRFENSDPFNSYDQLGLVGLPQNRRLSRFEANTYNTSYNFGGMIGMGVGGGLLVNFERRPSANIALTWITGSHTVRFGGDWRQDMLPTIDPTYADGHFQGFENGVGITGSNEFNSNAIAETGNATGFSYANFLLGGVRDFEIRTQVAYRTQKQQWGLFVQDTWRVSRNMTVNLGLRWDLGTYTKEDYGRNGGLGLNEPNPKAGGRLGALIYEATCKCQLADNYPYAVAPRLGISYTLNPRTVIRAGFGIAYGSTGNFGGYTLNSTSTSAPPDYTSNFLMREGLPADLVPITWPSFDPALGMTGIGPYNLAAIAGVGGVGGIQLLDSNAGRPSRTYQWNVSLQREINRNLVVEASYVGNRGVWQSAPQMGTVNVISQDLLDHYGFQIGNTTDYRLLASNTTLSTTAAADLQYLAAKGVVSPYGNAPLTAMAMHRSIRPYPQFQDDLNPARAPLGKSWYDALQVTINKRYSYGLMVNMNYTYAKNLQQTRRTDLFNADYGSKDLAQFQIPQQTRITFQYQTPRPASWMPVLGNKYVAYALEGWGIAMTMRYRTTYMMTRPDSAAARPITTYFRRPVPFGATAGIFAQLKKDPTTGEYMNPYSKDWVDYDGVHHTDPIDINCKCFDPTKTIVLDPTAWEAAPSDAWPDQTQTLPFFLTPRVPQESGNVSRNFRFGRDGRFNLNVRAEFQNVLNRLLMPSTITHNDFTTAAGPADANGLRSQGFGSFGTPSAGYYGAERQGSFVGRLTF